MRGIVYALKDRYYKLVDNIALNTLTGLVRRQENAEAEGRAWKEQESSCYEDEGVVKGPV